MSENQTETFSGEKYYLITEEYTPAEDSAAPALQIGDVVKLAEGTAEINGSAGDWDTAKLAELCAANGIETDAAFYAKTVNALTKPAEDAEADTVSADAAETPEQPAAEPQEEAYTAKQLLEDALDLIESVMTSVFVVMMVFTFVFCVATVSGESMVPTLTSGDRLMVNRFSKSYDDGEILILNSQTAYVMNRETGEFYEKDGLGKRIVKRLIAQAGEEVRIDFEQGIVYVNGTALDEPYVNTLTTRDSGAFSYPFTVPEGYVFVLGDNRNISRDSRHPDVGLVPVEDIVGAVVLRLTPLSSFGKLN